MTAASLSLKDASWSVRKGQSPILHPVSLDLAPGQVLGILGANGAGKSTLLRLIYRFHRPTTGSVHVDGHDIWQMTPKAAAQRVSAVLQEQPTDFALSVREIVALGRTPHRSGFSNSGARDQEIIQECLDRLDLHDFTDRRFGTLSGGERQRVMIARALAQQPQILVLDEPTNHLDIRHQLETLALVRDLDMTIVTSLHDLNMASEICDAVLLLQKGKQMGFGSPKMILDEMLVSETFSVDAIQECLNPSKRSFFTFHLPS